MREYANARADDDRSGVRTATATVVYAHGHERRFSALRHSFVDVIRTLLHGHGGGIGSGDSCIDVFVLEGDARRVRELVAALRGAPEALHVGVTWTDGWRPDADAEPRRGRTGRVPEDL